MVDVVGSAGVLFLMATFLPGGEIPRGRVDSRNLTSPSAYYTLFDCSSAHETNGSTN
jgi:hypothetical protein